MMLQQQVKSAQAVVDLIDGAFVAQGKFGTNSAGSPNFSEADANAFASVAVGDTIYISGEAAGFTVLTKTDNSHLIFSTNITNVHAGNAVWRARRGGIGLQNVLFTPVQDARSGVWTVFFDSKTFSV